MNKNLHPVLDSYPTEMQVVLKKIAYDDNFSAVITTEQFKHLMDVARMSDSELRIALLPLAAAYSHAPISKFHVGAIVRGGSGHLYFGANLEILSTQLGQTVHAEQSAISNAWANGESSIIDITISDSPCGHCRQFINETSTAQTLKIQLPERQEALLRDFLPDAFGPENLGSDQRLLDPLSHNHYFNSDDPTTQMAVNALNFSYAPYSKDHSGVAILLDDGTFCLGAYAENAAFNPSLPPLQMALCQVRLKGYGFDSIKEVALVEMTDGTVSHLADTQSTLDAINPDTPLTYAALPTQ
ncbi:cytidine deaminase [Vibrio sp.]|nr:cytidine deaminase [Vibrio sp.]